MRRFTTPGVSLIICLFPLLINAQGWEWARKVGGNQLDEIERVEVDSDGNVIVVGKFSGSFLYDGFPMNSSGSRNIFVSKYTSDGILQWVKTAGGIGLDEGLCVGIDKDDNILISGFYSGQAVFDTVIIQGDASNEVFVAKYGANGDFKWVRTAGGPGNDRGKGIDADSKGNVLVTGYYYDTCNFGGITLVSPGLDNIFVAKYDPDGNLLWVADAGGISSAWASSISTDAYDNAYLTGSFKGTASFGNHSITSYGGNDVFLARTDSSGNWTLAVNAGGLADDFGNGIEVDVRNHISVTGSFFQTVLFGPSATLTTNGDKDGFVAYYDPQGNCLWARNMGGTASDKGIDVSHDKDGNVYVAGHIYGSALFDTLALTGNGSDEVFLAKYDPTGQLVYALLAGGSAADFGKGMQVDKQGVSYIGGYFQGTASFGNHTLVSAGDRDGFVAKYYDGSPIFTQQPYSVEVCAGDSITLSVQVSGPGIFNYLWHDEAGSILGAVNPSYTLLCSDTGYSGKYYCVVSNAFAYVTSDTAKVMVHLLPQLNLLAPDTLYIHDTLVVDAGAGYQAYLWSNGDTTSSITLYPLALGTGVKQFSVTVTDAHGCQASDTFEITIVDVGMTEYDTPGTLQLFPNPANEQLGLTLPGDQILQVEVYSLAGNQLARHPIESTQGETVIIPTKDLIAGLYFLKVYSKKGVTAGKVLIFR